MPKNALSQSKNRLDDPVPVAGVYGPTTGLPPETWYDKAEQLSYGLGAGGVRQLEGYKQLLTHPVQSVREMAAGLLAVAKDPSVAANALSGLWGRATASPEGFGSVVGENLNPRNMLRNLARPNVLDIYKVGDKILSTDGRRGTIVSVRRFPEKDLSAWEAKRKELNDQAFQGYLAGTHTFDQGVAIFDELLKRNEDTLQRLYGKTSNKLTEIPKVLFENESRPTNLFDSDIETHFGGPVRK